MRIGETINKVSQIEDKRARRGIAEMGDRELWNMASGRGSDLFSASPYFLGGIGLGVLFTAGNIWAMIASEKKVGVTDEEIAQKRGLERRIESISGCLVRYVFVRRNSSTGTFEPFYYGGSLLQTSEIVRSREQLDKLGRLYEIQHQEDLSLRRATLSKTYGETNVRAAERLYGKVCGITGQGREIKIEADEKFLREKGLESFEATIRRDHTLVQDVKVKAGGIFSSRKLGFLYDRSSWSGETSGGEGLGRLTFGSEDDFVSVYADPEMRCLLERSLGGFYRQTSSVPVIPFGRK